MDYLKPVRKYHQPKTLHAWSPASPMVLGLLSLLILPLGVQSAILSVGIDKPKFFWEVDPFLKTMFGKEPIGALVMPDVVRPELAIDVETHLRMCGLSSIGPKRAKTDAGIAAKTLRCVAEKDEVG